MIASLKWLSRYVDVTLPPEALAERLTMAGLEIEAVHRRSLPGVVTARIERVLPHPKADRLHLCDVSDGTTLHRVVCGAPNAEAGRMAALALPGAELPGGLVIGAAVIRGEKSAGMLCSEKEMGVGEDASGIMLLPEGTALGVPLFSALGIEDTVLEVSITPNRGDCLSMLGIAREAGAICGTRVRHPEFSIVESDPEAATLSSVTILDPAGCPRYAGRIIRGVKIGPSPAWLRQALEAVGQRSINNIVDVTNFVMLEAGQPLHAFDFERLRERRIVVRRAGEGEKFTTLDGATRTLFSDTLLICDGVGPVAIAGIMGGLESEITGETSSVFLESACFDPICIRRTGKKIGLRTEAAYRFERGVDIGRVTWALDRAVALMVEVGGGEVLRGALDAYPAPVTPVSLTVRVPRTNAFLGTRLSAPEMAAHLRSIEIPAEVKDDTALAVTVPTFRRDITREVDIMEEVARLSGYNHIPTTAPLAAVSAARPDPHQAARMEVKEALAGFGFFEALTYSFIAREWLARLGFAEGDRRLSPVPVQNPLSEDQAVMRTSLLPGLLETARRNFDRQNEDVRLFELSKVFLPVAGSPLPEERHELAGVLAGRRFPDPLYGGPDLVDFTDAKGAVEGVLEVLGLTGVVRCAPGDLPSCLDPREAALLVDEAGAPLGCLGRLHPGVQEAFDLKRPVVVFECDFDRLFAARRPRASFRQLPRFPSVVRDMALVVAADLPVEEPLSFIRASGEALIEEAGIFDLYRGEHLAAGKKGVGYRIVYRAPDRTLTDEEANAVHQGLVSRVLARFDAALR